MQSTHKYDIHIASDVLDSEVERQLFALGYHRDEFAGGTKGIARPHHFSYHPESREEFDKFWNRAAELLSTTSPKEFFGFMEGESVSSAQVAHFEYKPFDANVPFPFGKVENVDCPTDKFKDYDVHVSADLATIDPKLKALLENEVGFYYADIRKPSGKVMRVYTFQPIGMPLSDQFFRVLSDYFQRAGGLEGKLKVEFTLNYARFPQKVRVPPVITRAPAGM